MMNGLSLKNKLVVTFTVIGILLVGLGVYAIYALQNVNAKTEDITQSWIPGIVITNDMIDGANAYKISLLKHVLASTPETKSLHEADLKKWDQKVKENIELYKNTIEKATYTSQAEKQLDVDSIKDTEEEWNEIVKATDKFIVLSRADKDGQAVVMMKSQMEPMVNAFIDEHVQPLIDLNVKGASNLSKEAADVYGTSKWLLTAVILLAVLICLAASTLLIRSIMGAIHELMRISKEVANGNLSDRSTLVSNDEFGMLGEAYNTVIKNTKTLIGNIQKTAEQVAASSEELTASADQSAEVTQQVAQSITEVATESDNQASGVGNMLEVMEKVSAELEKTLQAVMISADKSKQAFEVARNGNGTIDNAITQMKNIEETVNKSAEVVAKLGQRSKEIGQIVDTISGIAGQTNLLALNAAIEAARAGEQGRGFAVVAEEVRKLAEQSQEAAKQIAELIAEIQGDTENAVVAMNSGTKEVQAGTAVVNTAGQAFEEILKMIDVISEQGKGIAQAMQALSGGAQEIQNATEVIDKASKNVAAEAQTVSAATQQQSASMEEIAASSRSLANLAQDLQEASNKFRI